jgi:hypothetical protein
VLSVERVFGVGQIRNGIAAVAAEDRSTWSAAARAEQLIALRAAQERLDAEVLRAVADCDQVDAWSLDCLGATAWLATKTGMVRAAAARLARTARFLGRHAQTAKALDAADVTVPQVELLAEAAQGRDELYEEYESTLLDTATTV